MVSLSRRNLIKTANILGTGGHARVVISILLSLRLYDRIQIFELGELKRGEQILGFEVFSLAEKIKASRSDRNEVFFLAIGCNKKRETYWELLKQKKLCTPNLIAPSSFVDPSASLGEGNVVCPQAFLGPCSKVGNNNLINTSALLEHESHVGNHCHMGPKSVLSGRSTLGNSCFIGVGAQIIDQLNVASGTIIGAGGCLTKNILDENQTYAGVPAKMIKGSR